MVVFARVAGAPAGVVTLAYREGSTNGRTCPSNVPRGGHAVPDEVMGRQVAEFFVGDEGESVVLRNADPDSCHDSFTLSEMCLPENQPHPKEQAGIPLGHFAEVSFAEYSTRVR
jgi:hypothetical protein